MDYNRVQSYIKAHVLPKLDSLQLGMDGIPNLLTPSFDSIKNVLASITAKVDNVRGRVDLNHTTLTELQNRLTKVEGSVGKVEQDVGKVQTDVNLCKPLLNENVKVVGFSSSTANSTIVDVKGSGSLLALLPYDAKVELYIDGAIRMKLEGEGNRSYKSVYIAQQYVLGMASSDIEKSFARIQLLTPFVYRDTCHLNEAKSYDGTSTLTTDKSQSGNHLSDGVAYLSMMPIRFNSSLKLTHESSSASGTIAYTLE